MLLQGIVEQLQVGVCAEAHCPSETKGEREELFHNTIIFEFSAKVVFFSEPPNFRAQKSDFRVVKILYCSLDAI